jgi:hypothetical protein
VEKHVFLPILTFRCVFADQSSYVPENKHFQYLFLCSLRIPLQRTGMRSLCFLMIVEYDATLFNTIHPTYLQGSSWISMMFFCFPLSSVIFEGFSFQTVIDCTCMFFNGLHPFDKIVIGQQCCGFSLILMDSMISDRFEQLLGHKVREAVLPCGTWLPVPPDWTMLSFGILAAWIWRPGGLDAGCWQD